MRNLPRPILTLTLMSILGLMPLSEAASRVRQTPPLLTAEETLCYGFGELTYDLAVARDSGISVLNAISLIRQGLQGTPYASALNGLLTDVAQGIYEYQLVTPMQVRHAFTLACLKDRLFAMTTPAPAVTKKRY